MNELDLATTRFLLAKKARLAAGKAVQDALDWEMTCCNELTKATTDLAAIQKALNYEI